MTAIAPVTHGVTDRAVEVGGFRLTETSHVPDTRLSTHRHAYPAVTFVLRGGFVEDFGAGRAHECLTMSVLVKPSDAVHSNRYSHHGARSFILECTNECTTFSALEGCEPHLGIARLVVPLLELYAAFRAGAPERQLLAEEIAFEVARGQWSRTAWKTTGRPRWLAGVAEAAAAGCTQPLSLTTLASQVAVHPVYLARIFRRHYGQSIGAFVLQRRLRLAIHRLASTDEPISRIVLDCGFVDQSHFTRLLRRETGMPPGRIRRSSRTRVAGA